MRDSGPGSGPGVCMRPPAGQKTRHHPRKKSGSAGARWGRVRRAPRQKETRHRETDKGVLVLVPGSRSWSFNVLVLVMVLVPVLVLTYQVPLQSLKCARQSFCFFLFCALESMPKQQLSVQFARHRVRNQNITPKRHSHLRFKRPHRPKSHGRN